MYRYFTVSELGALGNSAVSQKISVEFPLFFPQSSHFSGTVSFLLVKKLLFEDVSMGKGKVKISLLQGIEAHRDARG
jgi:hypothetical protein